MSAFNSTLSLYIPYVPSKIADETTLIDIFEEQRSIGDVYSVDLIERISNDGNKYFQAFIHFNQWYETEENYDLQLDIIKKRGYRFYYTKNDYLILLKNKNKICDNCTNRGKMYYCGVCRIAKYCSLSCQRQSWTEHKKMCTKEQYDPTEYDDEEAEDEEAEDEEAEDEEAEDEEAEDEEAEDEEAEEAEDEDDEEDDEDEEASVSASGSSYSSSYSSSETTKQLINRINQQDKYIDELSSRIDELSLVINKINNCSCFGEEKDFIADAALADADAALADADAALADADAALANAFDNEDDYELIDCDACLLLMKGVEGDQQLDHKCML